MMKTKTFRLVFEELNKTKGFIKRKTPVCCDISRFNYMAMTNVLLHVHSTCKNRVSHKCASILVLYLLVIDNLLSV